MRRIALFITGTIAGLILLFSYRTSLGPDSTSDRGAQVAGPGTVTDGGAGVVTGPGGSASPGATGPSTGDTVTVNGSVAQTRWGPVQVRVVIAGGRINDVTAIQYPNGNGRDDEINSFALPRLHDEVVAAQSANIDAISGATVTSDGYIESLQAALDAVHFGR